MAADRRALVVDVAVAEPVRMAVGPVAWFVLESLAVDAPLGHHRFEVNAGTRQLATTVSLSKDTVARAMRRLIDAGVVERIDNRHPLSGRFGSTVYVIDLAAAGLTVLVPDGDLARASMPPRPVPTTTRTPSPASVDERQLTLLD